MDYNTQLLSSWHVSTFIHCCHALLFFQGENLQEIHWNTLWRKLWKKFETAFHFPLSSVEECKRFCIKHIFPGEGPCKPCTHILLDISKKCRQRSSYLRQKLKWKQKKNTNLKLKIANIYSCTDFIAWKAKYVKLKWYWWWRRLALCLWDNLPRSPKSNIYSDIIVILSDNDIIVILLWYWWRGKLQRHFTPFSLCGIGFFHNWIIFTGNGLSWERKYYTDFFQKILHHYFRLLCRKYYIDV